MVYLYFGGNETSLVSLESLHHFEMQTMLELRNTLGLEYFFFLTSGLDRK